MGAEWKEGAYMKVSGIVRDMQGKYFIVAYTVKLITNMNEVTLHQLETIYVHQPRAPRLQQQRWQWRWGHDESLPEGNVRRASRQRGHGERQGPQLRSARLQAQQSVHGAGAQERRELSPNGRPRLHHRGREPLQGHRVR